MENKEEQDTKEVIKEPVTEQQVTENSDSNNEPVKSDNNAAENFKRLREKNEQIERERDEARNLLSEIAEKERIAKAKEDIDDNFSLDPDELAEGKHLTKIQKKIKRLEEDVRGYKNQSDQLSIESRIKSKYTDFDSVVTTETIKELRNNYPEIADTINNSPNLYNKAVTAYTMIKKLNLVKNNSYDNDKDLAQSNHSKPRSVASISPQQGDSPMSKANEYSRGITKELKEQLVKEMDEARKRY